MKIERMTTQPETDLYIARIAMEAVKDRYKKDGWKLGIFSPRLIRTEEDGTVKWFYRMTFYKKD